VDQLELVRVFNDSSQYTCKVREGGIWWLFLSLETGFLVAGLLTYFPDASCRIEASFL
jgi:hypothetical protein